MAWMLITCTSFTLVPLAADYADNNARHRSLRLNFFRTNLIDDRSMTPSLFLPAVGVAKASFVGGQLVTYAYDISPRLAVPVIIVAYLLGILAIWLSIILYGVFFYRLLASGWPEPAKRPSLMMLVSHQ